VRDCGKRQKGQLTNFGTANYFWADAPVCYNDARVYALEYDFYLFILSDTKIDYML
jgi:hypothetical protein